MARKKVNVLKQKSVPNWIFAAVVLIFTTAGAYLYVKSNSLAEAQTYNKVYEAGKIVEKGSVKVFLGVTDSKPVYRNIKVKGKSIQERLNDRGSLVKGWELPTHPVGNWGYISKHIDIPKKTNSKKPIGVYICWKSTGGNKVGVKMMLFNDSHPRDPLRTSRGWDRMVYYHGYTETDEQASKYGCAGMNDVVIPGNKSSRKYRVFVKATEGGIRIAKIKVFTPPTPPKGQENWMTQRIDP